MATWQCEKCGMAWDSKGNQVEPAVQGAPVCVEHKIVRTSSGVSILVEISAYPILSPLPQVLHDSKTDKASLVLTLCCRRILCLFIAAVIGSVCESMFLYF
jgi:hypothetical protein